MIFVTGKCLESYHFLPGGGAVCLWVGTRIFWGGQRGWSVFFSGPKGGAEFLEGQWGGDQISFLNFFMRLRRNFFWNTLFKNFPPLRRNLSLYHNSFTITCSYIIIFLYPWSFTLFFFNYFPQLLMWVWCSFTRGGTRIFPQSQRGGVPEYFYVGQKMMISNNTQTVPPSR